MTTVTYAPITDTSGMIDPALNQTEMTIAAILITAALLLAVLALVVAVRSQMRAFWRTVPANPDPLRREPPDVCDPAWRELEADPDPDGDDGEDEDDEPLAARAPSSAATDGGNGNGGGMLIEIGYAIFTADEVEKLAAIRERWMAGAA